MEVSEYLHRLHTEYGPVPIYITENGASFSDGPSENGAIHDDRRIAYLASHIAATESARETGVPVHGYFVWSLFDNLEWVAGYGQRFGIIWVDFGTGERLPKDSYHWYRTVIGQGLPSGS